MRACVQKKPLFIWCSLFPSCALFGSPGDDGDCTRHTSAVPPAAFQPYLHSSPLLFILALYALLLYRSIDAGRGGARMKFVRIGYLKPPVLTCAPGFGSVNCFSLRALLALACLVHTKEVTERCFVALPSSLRARLITIPSQRR